MFYVVVGGLGLLVGLATAIGLLSDRQARNSAWNRIAAGRRLIAERLRELEQRELTLSVRAEELDLRESQIRRREKRLGRDA